MECIEGCGVLSKRENGGRGSQLGGWSVLRGCGVLSKRENGGKGSQLGGWSVLRGCGVLSKRENGVPNGKHWWQYVAKSLQKNVAKKCCKIIAKSLQNCGKIIVKLL